MKKHILKKFLHESELSQAVIEKLNTSNLSIPLNGNLKIKRIAKGFTTFLPTEDNKFFKPLPYSHNRQIKIIHEHDQIIV